MCGIAGIVHRNASHPVLSQAIKAMCDTLVHRGPDHVGYYVGGRVGLGMRRLSIIDLETGDQPIPNEDETIWIVFNGEIYNFRQLRRDLEVQGHRFRTTSDTEVIVHLYEQLGQNCVQRLRGMFAFAIWDTKKELLVLARDRLGIKPLYYAQIPDGLIFGSELKALLTHPAVSRVVNVEALWEYFTHLCVPGNLSIFQGVHKLPPAHVLTYRAGHTHLSRYWQIQPTPDETPSEAEWIEQLRYHLEDAVESHMVADVPVGAFLSGGLDSGTMVALMAQASKEPIRTFSVGFASDVGQFDERLAARTIAKRYGTQHYECVLEPHVADLLPNIVHSFDEPFADSSAIPNWLVCQETARHVKVAISGLGGDELFGGYERYLGLKLGEGYQRIPRPVRSVLAAIMQSFLAGRNSSYHGVDRLKRFLEASELSATDRYRHFIVAFAEARSILHPDIGASLSHGPGRYEQIINGLHSQDTLDLGFFADLYLYLPDDLLPLTDRISMAHSLEVRVPFLDHELVEFVARIPTRFKVHGLKKKVLFRKAVRPWLPKEHFGRAKQGFSIPLASWFRGPLRPMLLDLVDNPTWRQSPWLNHDAVKNLVKEHVAGKHNHENRLWAIICFREWERLCMSIPTCNPA